MSESPADLLRRVYPRVLAGTLGLTRSLPEAEDAVQEAIVAALTTWPTRGFPESPQAWLLTVAANKHRDRLRKGKWEAPEQDALETLSQMTPWARIAVGEPEVIRGWKDELLRLIFACCHPALEAGESAALCLSTVVGLSPREVAAAFLAEPRAMEQRLTRARRRLRERGDPEGRTPERSRDRLDAVLRVLHLLFNEGYWSSADGATPIRSDLCRLAIGLAHSLVDTFADTPEALGLLALFLFHDARRDARQGADGRPVPLPEQDRSRWDRRAIERAERLLAAAHQAGTRGAFQLEAAISALHCQAARAEDTDWEQIAALYAELEGLRPNPTVRVNRAFALARARGPAAGLALLDAEGPADASRVPSAHLVRGTLLLELGRQDAARAEFLEAERHARNDAERVQIRQRLERLGEQE